MFKRPMKDEPIEEYFDEILQWETIGAIPLGSKLDDLQKRIFPQFAKRDAMTLVLVTRELYKEAYVRYMENE